MLKGLRLGAATLVVLAMAGCGTKGGWMGADAEKAYDKELEAKRLAEQDNNDDYFEIHKDRRIYVLSDVKEYQSWLKTDEIPLVVTRIGAGPNGETVKLALIKKEAKAMEKIVGYKGGAQRMFEGELVGLEKGFYGEVHKSGKIWVFENGKDLAEFKKSGEAPCGITQPGAGPAGKTVVFVQNCKAAAKGKPDGAMENFRTLYAAK
jgi:predicted small lipoprotein YifL